MRKDQIHFYETVATPNFPAYAVEAVSGRYVVVGGGGGAARTGIRNKFDVYELYHNGKQTASERVVSHDVGSACIANMAAWCEVDQGSKNRSSPSIRLVLGQDELSVLLKLSPKLASALPVDDTILEEDIFGENDRENNFGDVRQRVSDVIPPDKKEREMISKRRKQERLRRESINSTLRDEKYITFEVETLMKKETVHNNNKKSEAFEDIYQKVVRVSPDHRTIATGGTDGYVRLWSVPNLELLKEFKAHQKEVDDLDFRPDGKQMMSLCKPTRECCVWNLSNAKKFSQLALQTNGVKYKFYRAKFGIVGNTKDPRLFTISNAVVGSKHPGLITKWNGRTYEQEKQIDLKGTLSCISVSDDGRFVATGTMDGAVYILIAFNLKVIHHVEAAHNVFVTDLAWLPTLSEESKMVRGFSDASCLSISCDNTLKIHHIPRQQMIPVWVVGLLTVIVLFCTFVLASYMGL